MMSAISASLGRMPCSCTALKQGPASSTRASYRCNELRVAIPANSGLVSHKRRRFLTKAVGVEQPSTATESIEDAHPDLKLSPAEANERRVTATIKKPLGMVLAEASNGAVFIESIEGDGNAAQQGDVRVGDVVRKTSARILKEGKSGDYAKKGHGARPYEDWEPVMFSCDGEDFQTVLAAVRSNNERWGIKEVTLEVSRPL